MDQMKSKGGSVRQNVTLTSWTCRNYASSKANDKRDFLLKVPIPLPDKVSQDLIIDLVDRILNAKKDNPNADTSLLEQQIEHIIYHLYGLTEEEIKIIEES